LVGIIPVGFANYMPGLFVLRGDTGWWMLPLTACIAGALFVLALFAWRFGISRYQSTGS
jgi:ABC-2 type transport system permease protein